MVYFHRPTVINSKIYLFLCFEKSTILYTKLTTELIVMLLRSRLSLLPFFFLKLIFNTHTNSSHADRCSLAIVHQSFTIHLQSTSYLLESELLHCRESQIVLCAKNLSSSSFYLLLDVVH